MSRIRDFRPFFGVWLFLVLPLLLLAPSSSLHAKRVAVIFGSNYTGNQAQIPPLQLSESDARLMESTLKSRGEFDDVHVFLGPMVTASNLEKAIADVGRTTGPNDTVLLYFSGHGTYQQDASAPNGLRTYIVMYDRPHVPDNLLNDWLKKIRSKKTVYVFDSCFSGGIVQKGRRGMGNVPIASGQAGTVIENGNDALYFKDKVLVSSSDSNETSIEITGRINHGLFTYWFTKGLDPENGDLNRDRTVTLLEAFEWSARRVSDTAMKFQHDQHPQIAGDASGIAMAGNLTPTPPPVVATNQPAGNPESGTGPQTTSPGNTTPGNTTPPSTVEPPATSGHTTPVASNQPTPTQTEEPQVATTQPEPTPSHPADPVTPAEPPVNNHAEQGKVTIYTTILQIRGAGETTMDPMEIIRRNRMKRTERVVRVMLSGKEYPTKIDWLNEKELRAATGETIPLGTFMKNGKVYENRVARLEVTGVPTGVHEVEIQADDYPVLKERLGVESKGENNLFVVASLADYGTIQGKVFLKNFESPLAGQDIWMPTVTSPNQIHRMKSTKDGSFWFLNLPPGDDYFIKASFLESLPLDNKKISVKPGSVTRVDVVLNKKLLLDSSGN